MLQQKTKTRSKAQVVVSTEDDRFLLMVDAVLGDVVESVRSLGSFALPIESDRFAGQGESRDILAIVDISFSGQKVKSEIDRVSKLSKHARIILVNRNEPATLEPYAGQVNAIVPYNNVEDVLEHVVCLVQADMSVVPGTVLKFGTTSNDLLESDQDLERLRSLSLTESRVMLALTEGLSNKQIARQINISDNTVRIHVRNIFLKLGVQNRTQAALLATRYWYTGVLLEKIEPLSA